MNATTFERVQEVLFQQLNCGRPSITPEAEVIADLGADSIDKVEIVMALEEEFDIEIDNEDEAKALTTVQQIVDLVDKHLALGD